MGDGRISAWKRCLKIEPLMVPGWRDAKARRDGEPPVAVDASPLEDLLEDLCSEDELKRLRSVAVFYVLEGEEPVELLDTPHLHAMWRLLKRQLEAPVIHDPTMKAKVGPTAEERFLVLQRDGFKCAYCGRSAPDVALHVDHIYPRSKGGQNAVSNLITACEECNEGKKDRILDGRM